MSYSLRHTPLRFLNVFFSILISYVALLLVPSVSTLAFMVGLVVGVIFPLGLALFTVLSYRGKRLIFWLALGFAIVFVGIDWWFRFGVNYAFYEQFLFMVFGPDPVKWGVLWQDHYLNFFWVNIPFTLFYIAFTAPIIAMRVLAPKSDEASES